jgi:hypothetical protein
MGIPASRWRRHKPDVWGEFPDFEVGSPEWNAAQIGFVEARKASVRDALGINGHSNGVSETPNGNSLRRRALKPVAKPEFDFDAGIADVAAKARPRPMDVDALSARLQRNAVRDADRLIAVLDEIAELGVTLSDELADAVDRVQQAIAGARG